MPRSEEEDTMNTILKIGQTIKGASNTYTLTHLLQDSVWKATDQLGGAVIVKSVNHWRLQNERDVLARFQSSTPHIRPLLDEVDPDTESHAIVLKWLDGDLLDAMKDRQPTSSEVKLVAKGILEALQVLHADGFVHTDVKPNNVLVNYADESKRQITEVQLADFGSTVSEESSYAKDGEDISTPIFRSPEAQLQLPWTTATDIWSFGITLIDTIYGFGFHIMKPDVPIGHEDYDVKILMRYHQVFGPYPWTYSQIAHGNEDVLKVLEWIMENTPEDSLRPFQQITSREISPADKAFLMRIMKLDPRDRPTAASLLADAWFQDV